MPVFEFNDESVKKYISFDRDGVLIFYGWSVLISHADMKFYLQRYFSADRATHLDPEKGFFRDMTGNDQNHRNRILSHKGAKMAFSEEEFVKVIEWLAGQYGTDV